MRAICLSTAIFLTALTSAVAVNRASTVRFTPPPEPGSIFAVFDYPRVRGTAEATTVTIVWGNRRRTIAVAPPYSVCSDTTPAGFVLRLRHFTTDQVPLTISTTGTILREPYQGEAPLESLHRCYQTVS
ncbi:MAG: hypothetical protein M3O15_06780 [Acidobacteriota bacterium]|nr:hypothetical protein [Acidobacteriota bacterium]